MVLLRYLATVLPALAAFLAFEFLFARPTWALQILGAWFLLFLGTHTFLARSRSRTFTGWEFVIPPATLLLAAATFALLVETPPLRHLISVLVSFLILLVEWNLYLFLYQPIRYQANALEHFSLLCNVLAVFFGVTSLFGLRTFLGLDAWKLLLLVLIGSGLLLYQSFWVSKIRMRTTLPYLLLLPALLTELTVALLLLPVTHLVQGTVFTIAYYSFFGIVRSVLVGNFSSRLARRYLTVSFAGFLGVLLTARWT